MHTAYTLGFSYKMLKRLQCHIQIYIKSLDQGKIKVCNDDTIEPNAPKMTHWLVQIINL